MIRRGVYTLGVTYHAPWFAHIARACVGPMAPSIT